MQDWTDAEEGAWRSADTEAAQRARRSAFAAAFLSLIPGLGHAYMRRRRRALIWFVPWAAMWTAAIIVMASRALGDAPETAVAFALGMIAQLTDSSVSFAALFAIAANLIYTLACSLSAYRMALDVDSPTRISGVLSGAGLVTVVLVLTLGHVALARWVYVGYDVVVAWTGGGGGDDEPIPSFESLPPELASLLAPVRTVAPTPTQSLGAGQTPAPTQPPTPAPTPTSTPSEGPGWDGKKRLDILLIGADSGRKDYGGYLTDTMIVMSIDPRTGRVALISLPRDTAGIPLPRNWAAYDAYGGSFPGKINTLYSVARFQPSLFPGNDRERGFIALKGALSELYGLDIKYHVAVNLLGFKEVIEALGGVIVDVQVPVQDDHYPANDGRGWLKLYIQPGMQHMTGKEALAYARSRHLSSDYDRAGRQQRVITSVREQVDLPALFAPGVIDRLLKQLKGSVKTNIPPNMLPKLVSLAQKVDLDRRVSLVLTPPSFSRVCYPCPPDGLWVLKANVPAIRRAVKDVFDSDPKKEALRQKVEAEGAVVHVLNGTSAPNFKASAIADNLAGRGIDAVVPPVRGGRADREDYRDTVITVYNGQVPDLENTIEALEKVFDVKAQGATDPAQAADIVVIVGDKTPALKP